MKLGSTHTSILSALYGLGPALAERGVDFHDPLTGLTIRRDPWVCFAVNENETGDDDDDDGEPPKTFTQDEVNKLIERRLAKESRKHAKAVSDLQTQLSGMEDLQAQLEELKTAAEAPPEKGENPELSKLQRELSKLSSAMEKLTAEKAEIEAARDAASTGLRDYIVRDQTRSALAKAGALPTAMEHATALMAREMNAALHEEDGRHVVVVTLDGLETDDLADAAKSWLKANKHFAAAPSGGTDDGEGGARPPRGSTRRQAMPEDITTADPSSLIRAGMDSLPK